MSELEIGINRVNFTGFVGENIVTFESKKGTPAVKFQIWVGPRNFGFYQRCVVYGSSAIKLSQKIKKGDLIWIEGKKALISFIGDPGYPAKIDYIMSKYCYILEASKK